MHAASRVVNQWSSGLTVLHLYRSDLAAHGIELHRECAMKEVAVT